MMAAAASMKRRTRLVQVYLCHPGHPLLMIFPTFRLKQRAPRQGQMPSHGHCLLVAEALQSGKAASALPKPAARRQRAQAQEILSNLRIMLAAIEPVVSKETTRDGHVANNFGALVHVT